MYTAVVVDGEVITIAPSERAAFNTIQALKRLRFNRPIELMRVATGSQAFIDYREGIKLCIKPDGGVLCIVRA